MLKGRGIDMAYKIESCQLSDIHELLLIEAQCHAFPWSKGNFISCFSSGYVVRKILIKRKVVGFYVAHNLPRIQESTLMDICVLPSYQGKGIGGLLIQDMLALLKQDNICTIFLEVRASNKPAIALYENYNFVINGVRKDYYPSENGREDAILMMLDLGAHQ